MPRQHLLPPPPPVPARVPQDLPQFLQTGYSTPLRPVASHPPPALRPPAAQDPFATHDVQLGKIFANMRAAMKVSRETIARRLATTGAVIEALESGTIASFPHHRETARIVRGYCDLLKLDPEPILWRIRSHYHASGLPMGLLQPEARPQPEPAATPPTVTTQRTVRTRGGGSRRRRRRSVRLLALALPAVLAGGMMILAQAAPATVYSALSWLPGKVRAPARDGFDMLVLAVAPSRDGLRWVEVGDPRLRKGDKLQTSRR
ncbi:MAG: helix-turn-helix domain-containing protein [Hyphomicrobiaceae bacterium]|nr:helix-turn-helix domain-containing protein [Hyphomicrobiaceae bacterium]